MIHFVLFNPLIYTYAYIILSTSSSSLLYAELKTCPTLRIILPQITGNLCLSHTVYHFSLSMPTCVRSPGCPSQADQLSLHGVTPLSRCIHCMHARYRHQSLISLVSLSCSGIYRRALSPGCYCFVWFRQLTVSSAQRITSERRDENIAFRWHLPYDTRRNLVIWSAPGSLTAGIPPWRQQQASLRLDKAQRLISAGHLHRWHQCRRVFSSSRGRTLQTSLHCLISHLPFIWNLCNLFKCYGVL